MPTWQLVAVFVTKRRFLQRLHARFRVVQRLQELCRTWVEGSLPPAGTLCGATRRRRWKAGCGAAPCIGAGLPQQLLVAVIIAGEVHHIVCCRLFAAAAAAAAPPSLAVACSTQPQLLALVVVQHVAHVGVGVVQVRGRLLGFI